MVGLLLIPGCSPKPTAPHPALESADPSDRIRAVVAAARADGGRPDPDIVVALVDRLDDEDEGVRFFAIAALDRLTGRRFGYRAHDPAWRRRTAVARWRQHLRSLAPEATTGPPAGGSWA